MGRLTNGVAGGLGVPYLGQRRSLLVLTTLGTVLIDPSMQRRSWKSHQPAECTVQLYPIGYTASGRYADLLG